jgi:alkaline phosphatase D
MYLHVYLSLFFLIAVTLASYPSNINYGSPSLHHRSLGISLKKIHKRNDPSQSYDPGKLNFTHGVASGDPYPDSVILWTRVAPMKENDKSNTTVEGPVPLYGHETQPYVKASKSPVCVDFKIASDQALKQVADSGRVYTSSDIDYTVKVRRPVRRASGCPR